MKKKPEQKKKSLLQHIPGFRSNKLWKKYVAGIGYLFLAALLLSGTFQSGGTQDKVLFLVQVLFILSVPFLIFCNPFQLCAKIPWLKAEKGAVPRSVAALVMALWLVVSALFIVVTSPLHTEDYQRELAALQQVGLEEWERQQGGVLPGQTELLPPNR